MKKELKVSYKELKEANPEDGGSGLFIFTASNGASFAVRETDINNIAELFDSDWLCFGKMGGPGIDNTQLTPQRGITKGD